MTSLKKIRKACDTEVSLQISSVDNIWAVLQAFFRYIKYVLQKSGGFKTLPWETLLSAILLSKIWSMYFRNLSSF